MSRRCAGWLVVGMALVAVTSAQAREDCDPPTLIGPNPTPASAQVAYLGPGDTFWTNDNVSKLVQVPPEFACAQWIKTQNSNTSADTENTNATYLTFQLLERAEVHVLYDRRVAI